MKKIFYSLFALASITLMSCQKQSLSTNFEESDYIKLMKKGEIKTQQNEPLVAVQFSESEITENNAPEELNDLKDTEIKENLVISTNKTSQKLTLKEKLANKIVKKQLKKAEKIQ